MTNKRPYTILKKSTIPQIEIIDDSLQIPIGWFTQYQIKTVLSVEGLRKRLIKLENNGNLQSKIGIAKINGNIRHVKLWRKT